ncbi:hypothetical protein JCM10207_003067 [Rhodosporidiobolus poonsookiae]
MSGTATTATEGSEDHPRSTGVNTVEDSKEGEVKGTSNNPDKATLLSLPPELVTNILHSSTLSTRDLAHCVLVSRGFHRLAEPILYSALWLRFIRWTEPRDDIEVTLAVGTTRTLLQTVASGSKLLQHVRKLVIRFDSYAHSALYQKYTEEVQDSRVREEMQYRWDVWLGGGVANLVDGAMLAWAESRLVDVQRTVEDTLKMCPGVHTLVLPRGSVMSPTFVDVFLRLTLPTITSLTIPSIPPGLANSFPNLRDLSTAFEAVVWNTARAPPPNPSFAEPVPTLARLDIASYLADDTPSPVPVLNWLVSSSHASLARLSIPYTIFCSTFTPDLSFLTSLTHLTLHFYLHPVSNSTTTTPLPSPAPPSWPPHIRYLSLLWASENDTDHGIQPVPSTFLSSLGTLSTLAHLHVEALAVTDAALVAFLDGPAPSALRTLEIEHMPMCWFDTPWLEDDREGVRDAAERKGVRVARSGEVMDDRAWLAVARVAAAADQS